MQLPELGVGLTYIPGLEPILEQHGNRIDVVELEPETIWFRGAGPDAPYHVGTATVNALAGLPWPTLLHGVGFPVGGTVPPDPVQIPLLREMIGALAPPWMSEHLSFNRHADTPTGCTTGFFLPPRQTAAGIRAAVTSVRAMAATLPIPLAVETGVNYLRPRRDEIPDGAFVATVVEAADCGLLLDLHNLWTNQRNGRQSVDEFLAELPLERVWEMHLAGGQEHDGYWLDAHSGAVPDPLFELATRVVPRLPNLRAIIFELAPDYLDRFGVTAVGHELDQLHRLWDRRRRTVRRVTGEPRTGKPVAIGALPETHPTDTGPSPARWESVLGALALGHDTGDSLADELRTDPGVAVLRHAIAAFRASTIASTLKLSTRLIVLHIGVPRFEALLGAFWRTSAPDLIASREAHRFADFLFTASLAVPHLDELLTFERAVLDTAVDGETRRIQFTCPPEELFTALTARRLPKRGESCTFCVEVAPDSIDVQAVVAPTPG